MAGTVSLQNSIGWTTYINNKSTANTTGLQYYDTKSLKAHRLSGAGVSVVRIPFAYGFEVTLPAFESDGITTSKTTYTFLNAYYLPMKVTYTGNAIA